VILLFDIDGTLIRCGGAGRAALEAAFLRAHGVAEALTEVRLDGSTDPVIIDAAFQRHFGRRATPEERAALMDDYLPELSRRLEAPASPYRVMAGVPELLAALAAAGRAALGLATGNDERGARAKLEPAALNVYFSFGGYGSDHPERPRLVEAAIHRGVDRLGRRPPPEEILVFGDTELDVQAAHAAGAQAVGVLAGASRPDVLIAARPEYVVESFADPRLWNLLGLGHPPGT